MEKRDRKNSDEPVINIKQLHYEIDSGKRLLGFITDENIYLKNRITEFLKGQYNNNKLDDVELFHNRILRNDEMIRLLRDEVTELEKLLVEENYEDGKIIRDFNRKMDRLRKNISQTEKHFAILKNDFNNYFSENM